MKIVNALSYLALGAALLCGSALPAKAGAIIITEPGGRASIRLVPSHAPYGYNYVRPRTIAPPLSVVPFGSSRPKYGSVYYYNQATPYYYHSITPRVRSRTIYNSILINPTIINPYVPYIRKERNRLENHIHVYPRRQRTIYWR
jgi:hypothetical protein